jgi:hypothetical protein
VRKRPKGRATRDMQEMPILRGFPGYLRKRFTLAFGEPITIAATGSTDTNVGGQRPLPLAHRASRLSQS